MLWYSVPFVGLHSEKYEEFKDYLLDKSGNEEDFRALDPRYKKVREYLNPKPKEEVKRKEVDCLELKDLVANMQRAFATKVTAIGNNKKGRICIDYYTKDDLDRLCDLIREWAQQHQ